MKEKLILVIEDDDSTRFYIRKTLELEGYNVRTLEDGGDAIENIRQEIPDLVITDIIMENKGGFEVIRDIKKEFSEIKIIAVSGGGIIDKKDVLKSAEKLGADASLSKPFKVEQLLETVKNVFGILGSPSQT